MALRDTKPLYVKCSANTASDYKESPPSGFDADLKKQWAKHHLEALKDRIEKFCNDYPCEVRAKEDIEGGFIQIETVHPPILKAIETTLELGNFVNCLRSSLDQLTWQLARMSGKRPGREIHFPICEQNTIDSQVRIAKATFGVPDEAIAVIKSFQPYHAGDAYKSTPLWRLNTLWNIDKHRHLSAFSTVTNWQYCLRNGYRDGDTLPIVQVDDCTVMRLPIAYKDEVEFNPHLTSDVRFFDDFEEIDIGLIDLIDIYEFVANEVLPAFTRFFPSPEINGKPQTGGC